MRALIRAATAPNLEDDQVLDDLIRTDGWQTVMTFARELARESITLFTCRQHESNHGRSATTLRWAVPFQQRPRADGYRRHPARGVRPDCAGERGWRAEWGRVQHSHLPALHLREHALGERLRDLWASSVIVALSVYVYVYRSGSTRERNKRSKCIPPEGPQSSPYRICTVLTYSHRT